MATDPLALQYQQVADRQQALRNEIAARYGPGAPSRLPSGRGFGPRANASVADAGAAGANAAPSDAERIAQLNAAQSHDPEGSTFYAGIPPQYIPHAIGAAIGGVGGYNAEPNADPQTRWRDALIGGAAGLAIAHGAAGLGERAAAARAEPLADPAAVLGRPTPLSKTFAMATDQMKQTDPGALERVRAASDALITKLWRNDWPLYRQQQDVVKAWNAVNPGVPLPPNLLAVEYSRIAGSSGPAAQVRIDNGFSPAVDKVQVKARQYLSQYLDLQDNLDKAAAIGQRVAGEQEPKVAAKLGDIAATQAKGTQGALRALQAAQAPTMAFPSGTNPATKTYVQGLTQAGRTAASAAINSPEGQAYAQLTAAEKGALAQANRQFSGGVNEAETRIGLVDLEQTVNKLFGPQTWQDIKDAADGLYAYRDGIRDRLVASGVFSQKFAQYITDNFPHYVHTDYVDSATGGSTGPTAQGIGLASSGVKALSVKGSETARVDPLHSLITMAFDAERRAAVNETANAVLGWKDIDAVKEGLMTKVQPGYVAKQGEAVLQVFKDGVRQDYAVKQPLADVIMAQPGGKWPGIVTGLASIAREAMVGENPAFLLGVAPQIHGTQYGVAAASRYGLDNIGAIAQHYVQAWPDAFSGIMQNRITGPGAQKLLSGGGGMAGFYGSPETTTERIYRSAAGIPITKHVTPAGLVGDGNLLTTTKNVLDAMATPLHLVGQRIDMVGRIAELRNAEQFGTDTTRLSNTVTTPGGNTITTHQTVPYSDPVRNIMASRTGPQDFAQGGTWTKALNQIIPFVNVVAQSPVWLAQMAAKNPKGASAALAAFATPVVASEAWNHADPDRAAAYNDIPDDVKAKHIVWVNPQPWLPPDANGIRHPNYFTWRTAGLTGPMLAAREATLSVMSALNAGNGAHPLDWQQMLDGLIGGASPIDVEGGGGGTAAINALTPMILSLPWQLGTNKNAFTGRAIQSQAADNTASAGGKVLSGLTGGRVAPSQADFAVRSGLGASGSAALSASDLIARHQSGQPLMRPGGGAPQIPVLGDFAGAVMGDRGGQTNTNQANQLASTEARLKSQLTTLRAATPEYQRLDPAQQKQVDLRDSARAGIMARMQVYGMKELPATALQQYERSPAYTSLAPEKQPAALAMARAYYAAQTPQSEAAGR